MAMDVQEDSDEPIAAINFIPMIDISLVLLIIFMVATTFVSVTGIDLKLPKASTAKSAESKTVSVQLNKVGKDELDVIEGKGPVEVARELNALVRGELPVYLLADFGNFAFKRCILGAPRLVPARQLVLQALKLVLKLNQGTLKLKRMLNWTHTALT